MRLALELSWRLDRGRIRLCSTVNAHCVSECSASGEREGLVRVNDFVHALVRRLYSRKNVSLQRANEQNYAP